MSTLITSVAGIWVIAFIKYTLSSLDKLLQMFKISLLFAGNRVIYLLKFVSIFSINSFVNINMPPKVCNI